MINRVHSFHQLNIITEMGEREVQKICKVSSV